jgi:hypothetical protein
VPLYSLGVEHVREWAFALNAIATQRVGGRLEDHGQREEMMANISAALAKFGVTERGSFSRILDIVLAVVPADGSTRHRTAYAYVVAALQELADPPRR